jgi:hypothetical protein
MGNGWSRLLMANRFRQFLESVVFAGMKPTPRSTENAPAPKTGLAGMMQRMISGPAVSDPMYLTNQTFGQKAKRLMMVAAPILILVLGAAGAMSYYGSKQVDPSKTHNGEATVNVLPDFHPDTNLDSNKNLDVLEVRFDHSEGNVMTGVFQNKTNHVIGEAVVVFDLFDDSASLLGGVTVSEANLEPGSSRKFQMPIEQSNAEHAVVRDVHAQ